MKANGKMIKEKVKVNLHTKVETITKANGKII